MTDLRPPVPALPYLSSLIGHEWRADSWDDGPTWTLVRIGALTNAAVGSFCRAEGGTYAWDAGVMKGEAADREQAIGAVELSVELKDRLRTLDTPKIGEPDFEGKMRRNVVLVRELVIDTLRRMHDRGGAIFDPACWDVRVEEGDRPGYVKIHLDQRERVADDGVIDLEQLARAKAALEGF